MAGVGAGGAVVAGLGAGVGVTGGGVLERGVGSEPLVAEDVGAESTAKLEGAAGPGVWVSAIGVVLIVTRLKTHAASSEVSGLSF